MRIVTGKRPSKHVEYRKRGGDLYRKRNAARMRDSRARYVPEFIGVDSEGYGRGPEHRTVLLGVGESHRYNPVALGWQEVFQYLYSQFEINPRKQFVGFYLGYDFNRWLMDLPTQAKFMLYSPQGRALRARKKSHGNTRSFPVRCDGWEFDLLGSKRLQLRPMVCQCAIEAKKCHHVQKAWMYVCDVGAFFQQPFLEVINPKAWVNDPEGPVCTDLEYATIKEGKENLRTLDHWDTRNIDYNRLENVVLARVMHRMARGMHNLGINLRTGQWYGPGASSAAWLKKEHCPSRKEWDKVIPERFTKLARWCYYGGWFELFSHGLIEGKTYNYDINNAYPYAISKLPCLLHGRYRSGHGPYNGRGQYVMVEATTHGSNSRMGPVPYRDKDGSILRPKSARGWYWLFEIQEAERAGLISKLTIYQWAEYEPCDCPPPLANIHEMYNRRMSPEVGKASAEGKVIKLTNNSDYGKFAQTIGARPYGNWLYASYITAHCRAQILYAIATHPDGVAATLMVATDGVCFDSVHPRLPVSKQLGDWEVSEYTDLCLFKPGVYWTREGRKAAVKIKSRGVPRKAFAEQIGRAEEQYRFYLKYQLCPQTPVDRNEAIWQHHYGRPRKPLYVEYSWPRLVVPVGFNMISGAEAMNRGKPELAGQVSDGVEVMQDSDPYKKRRNPVFNTAKNRIDTEVRQMFNIQTVYYQERDRIEPFIPVGLDHNTASGPYKDLFSAVRQGKEIADDVEWETVWNG